MPSDQGHLSAGDVQYRALPAQLVRIDGGVIVVRGNTEIQIVGEGAERAVHAVWSRLAEAPHSIRSVLADFAAPDRESIEALLRKLIDRKILVDARTGPDPTQASGGPESGLEIFYWNFGLREPEATASLNERKLVILGVNTISAQLATALTRAGVTNFVVVDFVLLRNQRLFGGDDRLAAGLWSGGVTPLAYSEWTERAGPGGADCIIATSDQGASSAVQQWNAWCVEHDIPFLPVLLQRLVGQVGPFVVPGQTACYDCLCARQNSHLPDHAALRAVEDHAPYHQAVAGFFPSMGSILGDIAAIELVKFFCGAIPSRVGQLLEVNLLASTLVPRKVLRVPRCRTCSRIATTPARGLERADFIPGPQFFEGDKRPEMPPLSPEERFGLAAAGRGED